MEARKVEAANGWLWIRQGYALFRQSPVLWVVLVMIGMAGLVVVASVPVVGDPLATLLFPVLLGGVMTGCRAQARGEELELAHLFAGFRQYAQPLVTLGGINLVSQLLILGIMGLTGGATLVSMMMSTQPETDPAAVTAAVAGAGLALLAGGALFCVLLLAMLFAPALVVFGGLRPVDAMKTSLRACLRNVGALSIYGIAIILLGLLASMPLMLGWLILLPLMATSMYSAYCDMFPGAGEGEETPRTAEEAETPPPGGDGQTPA